ncbi:TIGR03086 family protein [Gordonia polyisoprenivorans]|uniref:TIGR03086 family protein n=1 Tax=Gordonia polyisoprenivorans TaxID=84595 RepID=UPI001AD74A62|nr:TIGR03086 family protein [Gordonia polyisoprenivorans]QTI70900.1 TIGR03086 family protein [Gordonia polyisoprenivorans]
MTNTQPADPRPFYTAATQWVGALIVHVRDDQLDSPAPCDDFDVRTDEHHDPATYNSATDQAVALWSDNAKLVAPVRVPWGEAPGAGALWGCVNEIPVRGWDLAVATGQNAETEPALAETTLAIARQFIPAEIRAVDEVAFDAVVGPRATAGATERLANWSGREPAP